MRVKTRWAVGPGWKNGRKPVCAPELYMGCGVFPPLLTGFAVPKGYYSTLTKIVTEFD